MSYPGPLSTNVNLGCDTGNQRATDVFNFQLNTGAAGNESTLQSPAAIIPDGTGNVSLTMTSGAGSNTASLFMTGGPAPGAVSGINIQGGTVEVDLVGTNGSTLSLLGGATQSIHFTDPTTTGIAVYQDTATPGQLAVGNDSNNLNIATFNRLTNTVELGNPLSVGQIYLNNRTTVTNSGTRPPPSGLVIENNSATESAIYGQVSTNGELVLGSSAIAAPDILTLADTGNNTGTVVIGGNGGNNILFQGSTNNAAATISTDRAPGNLGVLTIGGSVGAPAVQFSDSGTAFTQNVQTALNVNLTIRGDIDMATDGTIINYANYNTAVNAAIGSGVSVLINSTNPPPNGQGLYCVTIYAPSDITANVSAVAYWDGSVWRGGSVGNAAYRIQTAANFQSLTFFNTSGTTMNGSYATNVYQILGPA